MSNEFSFEFECDVDWDSMEGDGAVRFCATCSRNVFNIEQVDVKTAEWLADAHEECVRVPKTPDGRVLLSNGLVWGVMMPMALAAGCMSEPPPAVPVSEPPVSLESDTAKLSIEKTPETQTNEGSAQVHVTTDVIPKDELPEGVACDPPVDVVQPGSIGKPTVTPERVHMAGKRRPPRIPTDRKDGVEQFD